MVCGHTLEGERTVNGMRNYLVINQGREIPEVEVKTVDGAMIKKCEIPKKLLRA